MTSVWPCDATGTAADGRPAAASWLALPTATQPRVLLPLSSRRAAARGLLDYGLHTSRAHRVRTAAVAHAVQVGLGPVLARGGRLAAPSVAPPRDLLELLAEVTGGPTHVVVRLGPPRRNRKPVLQLFDDHGRLVAVAKVGVDALTSDLVRHEHAALTTLAARPPARVQVPEARRIVEWRGRPVAVQGPLPLRSGRPATEADLTAVADWVAAAGTRQQAPVLGSGWWRAVGRRVELAPTDGFGSRLRHARETVALRLAGVCLDTGAWHGDLTPWNMSALDGSTLVWDWERYAPDVPVGFDLLHHLLQRRIHGAHAVDAVVGSWLCDARTAVRGRLPAPVADTVARCYALELATRYVTEGQTAHPHGRQVTDALLAVVDRWEQPPGGRAPRWEGR